MAGASRPVSLAEGEALLSAAMESARITEDIKSKLQGVEGCPDVAVELSTHIPRLLGIAAEESANFLNGRQSWVIGKGHMPWRESVHLCIDIIGALQGQCRLPQQEVLDTFTLAAAATGA
jgi:hypothetical protein